MQAEAEKQRAKLGHEAKQEAARLKEEQEG